MGGAWAGTMALSQAQAGAGRVLGGPWFGSEEGTAGVGGAPSL